MTDSAAAASAATPMDPLAQEFMNCLEKEAKIIESEMETMTPMIAQARAILYMDTIMRLHEAGLDEALKINDATQSSAWMRDLSVIELSLSLLRNIQPLDAGGADQDTVSDAVISTN